MDSLWEEFDDLELRDQPVADKGKQPVDDSSDEDEDDNVAPQPLSPSKGSEPGDLTCAICLSEIPLPDLAMVKGCAHIYCAKCIVAWALHRETPACPQCKQPFSYLLTYRTLDGALQDFPTEESVVLLKRARWLEEDLKRCLDGGTAAGSLLDDARLADDLAWHDYADDYDLAEDEAIEQFYFSSAAGRARITVGNRRFGEGGFVSGGRRCARPTPPPKKGKGKGGKAGPAGTAVTGDASSSKGKASRDAAVGGSKLGGDGAGGSRSVDIRTPNANGGQKHSAPIAAAGTPGSGSFTRQASFLSGESPSAAGGAGSLYGSSPAGSGRRARRNARRAASDAVCVTSTAGFEVSDGSGASPDSVTEVPLAAVEPVLG